MRTSRTRVNEKGFVLLLVYIVVLFISIFSVAFFARHQGATQATERYQNRILAFNAAEAGIDYALRELATNSGSRRTNTATTPYTSSVVLMPAQNPTHAFQYTITKTTNNLIRRIDATGCAPNCTVTSRAHQTANITVYAQIFEPGIQGGLFDYGVYTTGKMDLSGFRFDSYTSSLPYGGANISGSGVIASNSTAIGAISMTNTTTINGSVAVSADGNPNTGISTSNNSTIVPPVTDPPTPAKGKLPTGWTLGAPPAMASLTTPPTELGSVETSLTLPAGTYHATEIKLSGKERIVSTGAVKIYVDGGIDITGQGTTAAANKPGNLQFYVTGTASVSIKGNGSFTGGLYAPNSDVTFQTSNSGKGGVIYGSVVAKTFTTYGGGNPTVHFDLAMKTTPTADPNQTGTVNVVTWQEMNTLAWDTGNTVTLS